MSFLNPLLLLGVLGLSLPILAHMLNRFEVQRTDWAAMQFLNRSVRVRSRKLRIKDIILLVLRCLAMLLLVLAFTRPSTTSRHALVSALGEKRTGVVIALDASFSMQHSDGTTTRFERALEKVESIANGIRPGDTVALILLGAEHRTVVRNVAFDADAFAELLSNQKATSEALHVDSVPRILKELAAEMKTPQKEIYIVTDMQEQDWEPRSTWLQESFKDLALNASVFLVPIEGGAENGNSPPLVRRG